MDERGEWKIPTMTHFNIPAEDMGQAKRFWTLKYPFIWYDVPYLAEVLTRFESLKNYELIKELIEWMERPVIELTEEKNLIAYRDLCGNLRGLFTKGGVVKWASTW